MSTDVEETPVSEEAVFVAYQDPTPMIAQHLEQLAAVTATLRPRGGPVDAAVVEPLSDDDKALWEEFKKFRQARDTAPEDTDTVDDDEPIAPAPRVTRR